MKRILFLCILISLNAVLIAQAPSLFRYQTVVRNDQGEPMPSHLVSLKFNIVSGDGDLLYSEEHTISTGPTGSLNLTIGEGGNVIGNLADIDWGDNIHYLDVYLDPEGGSVYNHMGQSQLVSVPYALHANSVENDMVEDADSDTTNEYQVLKIVGDTLFISNGGYVILPSDEDTDPENELQELSYSESGDSLFITNGGYVILPSDEDTDPENELQELSFSETGDTLFLSQGNFIIIPDLSIANNEEYNQIGMDSLNPGKDCNEIYALNFLTRNRDDTYWIDPDGEGGVEAFKCRCNMSAGNGGWIELSVNNTYNIYRGSGVFDNGWDKSSYQESNVYQSLPASKDTFGIDAYGFDNNTVFELKYLNPATDSNFTAEQLASLRSVISMLHPQTRMVATETDADDQDYHNGNPGHEVYIYTSDESPDFSSFPPPTGLNLTEGTTSNEEFTAIITNPSGFYVECFGDCSSVDPITPLPHEYIIPDKLVLSVHSGGGVSWGYERAVFLVQ